MSFFAAKTTRRRGSGAERGREKMLQRSTWGRCWKGKTILAQRTVHSKMAVVSGTDSVNTRRGEFPMNFAKRQKPRPAGSTPSRDGNGCILNHSGACLPVTGCPNSVLNVVFVHFFSDDSPRSNLDESVEANLVYIVPAHNPGSNSIDSINNLSTRPIIGY